MNAEIVTKVYGEPLFCEKEILRYAGCKNADDASLQLLRNCMEEIKGKLVYKVCFLELPIHIELQTEVPVCDLGYMKIASRDLAKNLQGCHSAILFAATIGIDMDRLIGKYSRISPAKALMLQAIGTERIEALCDMFCAELKNARPRFSPGYGDVSLDVQKDVFRLLDCPKHIGVSLSESLLMTPSKSVTAFVGMADRKISNKKCMDCSKKDCAYREDIQ